jgi:hypothetical protein
LLEETPREGREGIPRKRGILIAEGVGPPGPPTQVQRPQAFSSLFALSLYGDHAHSDMHPYPRL